MMEVIKTNVKAMRIKANLTQQQLADKTGLARMTIYRVENGTHNPSADTLLLLRKALHCTVDELLDERKTG